MDALVSTFHIDLKTLLFEAFNFAIVVWVLWKFAFKPLSKNIEERNTEIERGLDDAKKSAALIADTQRDYEETLAKARKEASTLLASMKKEAAKTREELLAQAYDEVRETLARGKEDLENEKNRLLAKAQNEIADMVVSATEKVLGKHVSLKVDREIVESSLK